MPTHQHRAGAARSDFPSIKLQYKNTPNFPQTKDPHLEQRNAIHKMAAVIGGDVLVNKLQAKPVS
jgi:hypothetical protein